MIIEDYMQKEELKKENKILKDLVMGTLQLDEEELKELIQEKLRYEEKKYGETQKN